LVLLARSGADERVESRVGWGGLVAVVARGEVIRFDQVKGYGFISPNEGGDDVFLHVNDLLDDKHLVRPGSIVEYVVENGERGLKAASVHVVIPSPGGLRGVTPAVQPAAVRTSDLSDDELVDVLTERDFLHSVTEILLQVTPGMTGPQVLAVRQALSEMARHYGWIGK
jgi:cold shock CspA family protein